MSDLSPKARELLRRASRGGGPSERQRRSVKAAVAASVLAPGVAVAGAGMTAAKLVLVGIVSVAAGAGVMGGAMVAWKATQRPVTAAPSERPPPAKSPAPPIPERVQPIPEPQPPVVAEVAPSPAPPLPTPVPVQTRPEPMHIPNSTPAPAMPTAPTSLPAPLPPPESTPPVPPAEPGRDEAPAAVAGVRETSRSGATERPAHAPRATDPAGLRPELEALDRAVRAVDAERYAEGLAEARGFQANYPQSEFTIEARVVEVLALCGLARVDEARFVSAALPASAAGNPVLRRLERSCAR